MERIFLLSPAHAGGERAQLILSGGARFELAERLRSDGAPLGDVFAFLSGLYFRGKLAYAGAFAAPPPGLPGSLVITAGRGLLPPETPVTVDELRQIIRAREWSPFQREAIFARDGRERAPLVDDEAVRFARQCQSRED